MSGLEMRLELVLINDTEKLSCFIIANEGGKVKFRSKVSLCEETGWVSLVHVTWDIYEIFFGGVVFGFFPPF